MVERPEHHVAAFAEAGADGMTVHVEATPHVHYAIQAVREAGCRAGVALNPATPVEAIAEVAELVDLVLCMTVDPGWGGQPFIPRSPDKVARLRALLPAGTALEVDGGIDADTAPAVVAAGATHLVAGSAIFGAVDPAEAYRRIDAALGPRRSSPESSPHSSPAAPR
jgi:ribulose-phosphate 3-epimerase